MSVGAHKFIFGGLSLKYMLLQQIILNIVSFKLKIEALGQFFFVLALIFVVVLALIFFLVLAFILSLF